MTTFHYNLLPREKPREKALGTRLYSTTHWKQWQPAIAGSTDGKMEVSSIFGHFVLIICPGW